MKRVLLLLGICFFVSTVYAQRFEGIPLEEKGDSYEVRIKNFDKLYGEMFTQGQMAPLVKDSGKTALRAKWRETAAGKLLTDKLKQVLKQVGQTEGGGLWVTFYVDATGKVLTVKFMMSSTVYMKLPGKMLKELYNMAMEERFNSSCYGFDATHIYAIDGFDLMKRAIENERK